METSLIGMNEYKNSFVCTRLLSFVSKDIFVSLHITRLHLGNGSLNIDGKM